MVLTRTALRFKPPPISQSDDSPPVPRPGIKMSKRRTRGGLIATFALIAGATAGLAAAAGSGPFAGLRPHITYAQVRSEASQSPTSAKVLFPAPTPMVVNKVVTVIDPAPPAPMKESDDSSSTASSRPTTESDDHHAPPATAPVQPTHPPGGDD